MKRVSLVVCLMLVALANLVFAADWHETTSGSVLAEDRLAEGSVVVAGGDHRPADHDLNDTDHPDHPHPPGGSCMHSHSCHGHAHLFSLESDGYGVVAIGGLHWHAESLPLPPQHFMAPDVPPPIRSRV